MNNNDKKTDYSNLTNEDWDNFYQKGLNEINKLSKQVDEEQTLNLPLTSTEASELYALLELKLSYTSIRNRLWNLMNDNERKLADKIFRNTQN